MSLREEWYAARVQRQQEVRERQQQVAAFLQDTRLQQQQVWLEQQQQRTAYVAALQDYVWGTTPTPETGSAHSS
ncbi:hypothetical protein DP113_29840 [Brasilonema octagenarum UFV-E1]|uniref:Uncharacterized protein n=2 Tax=Brasilonema TaxID=383614 RepID=A0A856MJG9_9CYAN|nr:MULTISPECIES: hypothetical protein [Brasilonema]NMF61382.1 hypothetical protein [Brasilonema octagenarum UFV-OR1]QDL11515.1 hypothetical protein DP114_29680 [Brasilonema sennae CENA114]QDL17897.1 hypothetical protein DP113_29840 [Brasilonema octagenarum UFV-E1]